MRNSIWCAVLIGVSVASGVSVAQNEAKQKLMPGSMPKIATVDARFLSYNVEMVEVTGGRFWAPYASAGARR